MGQDYIHLLSELKKRVRHEVHPRVLQEEQSESNSKQLIHFPLFNA